MGQLTIRAADELVARVRSAAGEHGRSMNDYVTSVLDAATNPDLGSDEAARVRERLGRAGLLVTAPVTRLRPPAPQVAAARAAAGRGTPLSELVADGRR